MRRICIHAAVILTGVWFCAAFCGRSCAAGQPQPSDRNIILIGWDGVSRDVAREMLDNGELPNLKKLAAEGSFVLTEVTAGETHTKPGWAEILTGYSSPSVNVHNNRDYGPIPRGYTVFERLKAHFGNEGIATIFIGGKCYNIGARGPHEICMNCRPRDPVTRRRTHATDRSRFKSAGTMDGLPPRWEARAGDPYFYSRDSIDCYAIDLGAAQNVARRALREIDRYKKRKFFAFIHFEDPDEMGHRFAEPSVEYRDAIRKVDRWLGVIMKRLSRLGLSGRTDVYVTTDHGFDKGTFIHDHAPHTFLVSRERDLREAGDRMDVTPTILESCGIDPASIGPPLEGRSLRAGRPVRIAYFHGGRVHGLYRTHIFGHFRDEGVNCEFFTQYLRGKEFVRMPGDHETMMAESGKMLGRVTGRRIIEAIEAGIVDGGTPGESSFIEAAARGAPIVAVALLGYDRKEAPGKGLLLRRDVVIARPEDFKGRAFGTRRAGPGDKIFLCEFFKSIGLDPAKDVTIIDQIPDDEMNRYLRRREIDGYFFHLHSGRAAIESGLGYLYRPMDWMNPEQSFALLVFHRDYLSSHPVTVRKFLSAYMKRIRYEQGLSALEKAREKDFGLQMTLEYQGMDLPQYKFPPLVPVGLLRDSQKLLRAYDVIDTDIDIEKYVDNRFVLQLHEQFEKERLRQ